MAFFYATQAKIHIAISVWGFSFVFFSSFSYKHTSRRISFITDNGAKIIAQAQWLDMQCIFLVIVPSIGTILYRHAQLSNRQIYFPPDSFSIFKNSDSKRTNVTHLRIGWMKQIEGTIAKSSDHQTNNAQYRPLSKSILRYAFCSVTTFLYLTCECSYKSFVCM